MNKTLKKCLTGFMSCIIMTSSIVNASASTNTIGTTSSGKQYYIPKTCSSSASATASGIQYTGLAFKVTKILDGNKNSCNYKRIRVKINTPSDVGWVTGCGFSGSSACSVLSSSTSVNLRLQLYKGTQCEIYKSDAINTSTTTKVYYYGNSTELDAYATIVATIA